MDNIAALEVLALAMDREKGGEEFYLKAAKTTSDPKGNQMFEWLAKEEKKHFQLLERQQKALKDKGKWETLTGAAAPVLGKSLFPDISEVSGMVTAEAQEIDALHVGIKAEKESIALYQKAANETADAGARAMFERLVQEEQGHLELLEAEHDWIRQAGKYFTLHRFALPPR